MSTLCFFGIVLAGWASGMYGSVLGMVRGNDSPPRNQNSLIMVLLWVFVVLSYWPLQLAKLAIAITTVYFLYDSDYVLINTCAICFASGFFLMRAAPSLANMYRNIKARLKIKRQR